MLIFHRPTPYPFCTRLVQHAKPLIYGLSGDDEKITLCETRTERIREWVRVVGPKTAMYCDHKQWPDKYFCMGFYGDPPKHGGPIRIEPSLAERGWTSRKPIQ